MVLDIFRSTDFQIFSIFLLLRKLNCGLDSWKTCKISRFKNYIKYQKVKSFNLLSVRHEISLYLLFLFMQLSTILQKS
ncbi:unnamed protein product, partial [Coccothraustes coccothraustes]